MIIRTTDCILTADVSRVAKCGGNVRIKVDHEITLFGKPIVAVFDLLRDPLPEVVTAEGIDDIDDPLPWQLIHISLFWQVKLELVRTLAVLKDRGDGQRFVHGHVQMLCVLRFDDYRYVGEEQVNLLFFSPRTISLRK